MSASKEINYLKDKMIEDGINPKQGLGEELFLFASTLLPVVNVDLLIYNDRHEILLCWRDDKHCGTGWHIPGGCLRLGETLENRVYKTAIKEIGVDVLFDKEPVKMFEIFSNEYREGISDQRERSHFITLAFACRLQKDILIDASNGGCMKWFKELPDDLLEVQNCYKNSWNEIKAKIWRK